MDYQISHQAFMDNLAVWRCKGRTMDGIEFLRLESGLYEAAVLDYGTQETSYLTSSGPYKTWRGAFSAVGAALDKIDNED